MHKKKVLLSLGTGNGNSGDEALLVCEKQQLEETFNREIDLVAFSDDIAVSEKYINGVRFIYSGRFGIRNKYEKGIKQYQWIFSTIHEICICDVLITGGGTILQDATNKFFVPFWFFKIILAQIFFKPTVMYGIGVGPLNRKFSRFLMNAFASKMKFISLRGPLSLEWIKKFKIKDNKVFLTADPVITLEKAGEEEVKELFKMENIRLHTEKKTVVFCIRDWYKKHGKSIVNKDFIEGKEQLYSKYIQSILDYVKFIVNIGEFNIVFLPMSCTEPNDDRLTARKVLEKLKEHNVDTSNVFCVNTECSPALLKAIIGKSYLTVGVRFHTLIYATTQNIPVIGVAYGNKTCDFLEYIGLKEYVLPIDEITGELLIEMHKKVEENREAVLSQLKIAIPLQKEMATRNAQMVKNIVMKDTDNKNV
jgi:polysaccharide pyruvyl transferase WcaK-like protein